MTNRSRTTAYCTAAQNWTDITPCIGAAPPARAFASAVFDTQERRMIVFGGESASGRLNDVWAFDTGAGTWTELLASLDQ